MPFWPAVKAASISKVFRVQIFKPFVASLNIFSDDVVDIQHIFVDPVGLKKKAKPTNLDSELHGASPASATN